MLNKVAEFMRDEEGASAVEYGLIVGLIAVVIITVLIAMGGGLNTLFGKASTAINNAATGTGG